MLNLSRIEAYGISGVFEYLRQMRQEVVVWARRVLDLQTSTPAQLVANVNNYDMGLRSVVRLSSDASRNITGLDNVRDTKMILLINVGSFDIVLTHEDASSSIGNRIITITGASVTLAAAGSMILIYDAVSLRWRQIT